MRPGCGHAVFLLSPPWSGTSPTRRKHGSANSCVHVRHGRRGSGRRRRPRRLLKRKKRRRLARKSAARSPENATRARLPPEVRAKNRCKACVVRNGSDGGRSRPLHTTLSRSESRPPRAQWRGRRPNRSTTRLAASPRSRGLPGIRRRQGRGSGSAGERLRLASSVRRRRRGARRHRDAAGRAGAADQALDLGKRSRRGDPDRECGTSQRAP
jgi:hypothetical protein